MPEDKEPPEEASPTQSEVTVEYYVESSVKVTHVISSTPPAPKPRPPGWVIPPQLAPFKRPAWVPVVEEGDGAITDSKFAGTPWLGASEEWPVCPNCGNPIRFILQLDLAQLPEAVAGEYGSGLLQMFYCTNEEPMCDIDCEGWEPFAESVVVRLVEPEGGATRQAAAELEDPFPAKRIAGWREVEDYPGWQEGARLGVELDEEDWIEVSNEPGFPRTGDKLAGWPYWVQDVEYPDCPRCGVRMRLLFQVDSNDNVPFSFGDGGCGHITQCPEHKDVVAFGWACV